MKNNDQVRSNLAQEAHILKCYIDDNAKERKFASLKRSGFFNALSIRSSYKKLEDFLDVIDSVAITKKYKKNSVEQKEVKKLKENWRKEIIEICKCVDCYESFLTCEENENYFTLVCTVPHLLVHIKEAKEDGPRTWTAKVLSVINGNKVYIECFGDHLRGQYKFGQCFLYSDAEQSKFEKANQKHAKNKKLGLQKEYDRSFSEVKRYIENIKERFGAFVPAPPNVVITDVEQHLIDMFPRYTQSRVVTSRPEPPTTTAVEEANNDIETSDAGPSTSNCESKNFRQMVSPYSQGYESNDHDDSDDANYSEDFDYQNFSARSPTPIELPAVDLKIEAVEGNYSQHEAEPINESQATETVEVSQREARKRKRDSAAIVNAKKASRASQVVEDGNNNESTSSSTQNHAEPVMHFIDLTILREYGQIEVKIAKCKEQLVELKEQENLITANCGRYKAANDKESFDKSLKEYGEICVKISKCEDELVKLNAQVDITKEKI